MADDRAAHWHRTKRLMIITLSIWFIFAFLVHWFAHLLNNFSFLGFPLGFYMAAQGSLVVFVVLIFLSNKAQDKIDRDCGVAEDQ